MSPAAAIGVVIATQVDDYDHTVTIQFDISGAGYADVSWTTGDGYSIHPEGGTGLISGGPDQGTGTFANWGYRAPRPTPFNVVKYDWWRTEPQADVVRTAITFEYMNTGTYTLTWGAAGQSGALAVSVPGSWHRTSSCQVNPASGAAGTIVYDPPILQPLDPQAAAYTLDVVVDCGPYPGLGRFNLHVTGNVAESCLGGYEFEDASVTGTRSTGQQLVSGRWHHRREHIHLIGNRDPAFPGQGGEFGVEAFDDRVRQFRLDMWIDLTYPTALVCPGSGGDVRGQATVSY